MVASCYKAAHSLGHKKTIDNYSALKFDKDENDIKCRRTILK